MLLCKREEGKINIDLNREEYKKRLTAGLVFKKVDLQKLTGDNYKGLQKAGLKLLDDAYREMDKFSFRTAKEIERVENEGF
jgi:hypothetical protein